MYVIYKVTHDQFGLNEITDLPATICTIKEYDTDKGGIKKSLKVAKQINRYTDLNERQLQPVKWVKINK